MDTQTYLLYVSRTWMVSRGERGIDLAARREASQHQWQRNSARRVHHSCAQWWFHTRHLLWGSECWWSCNCKIVTCKTCCTLLFSLTVWRSAPGLYPTAFFNWMEHLIVSEKKKKITCLPHFGPSFVWMSIIFSEARRNSTVPTLYFRPKSEFITSSGHADAESSRPAAIITEPKRLTTIWWDARLHDLAATHEIHLQTVLASMTCARNYAQPWIENEINIMFTSRKGPALVVTEGDFCDLRNSMKHNFSGVTVIWQYITDLRSPTQNIYVYLVSFLQSHMPRRSHT